LSSRSSSNAAPPEALPVGRVRGHRGRSGEITVVVPAGDAEDWLGVDEFCLQAGRGASQTFHVESSRAYGNRLVLKFSGIDDGNQAAGLKGMTVTATKSAAPSLESHEHYRVELVGMKVVHEDGSPIGTVADVWPTGAADLLVVSQNDKAGDDELFIPLSREIVPEIDRESRTISVRPPDGLLEINHSEDPPQAPGVADEGRR